MLYLSTGLSLSLSPLSPSPCVCVKVFDVLLSSFDLFQVFDSMIEYSVKTVISVLSSSINCKAIRCGEETVLSIGCLISSHDVVELVETCGDILGKLKARGVSEEVNCTVLSYLAMLFTFEVCQIAMYLATLYFTCVS